MKNFTQTLIDQNEVGGVIKKQTAKGQENPQDFDVFKEIQGLSPVSFSFLRLVEAGGPSSLEYIYPVATKMLSQT